MADTAKDLIGKSAPWRSDVKWPIVAIESVLLIALGIWVLVSPDSAKNAILQITGTVFLIVSVQLGIQAFRGTVTRVIALDAFRAGIGVTVSLIATSGWWTDYIGTPAIRVILGWGLIAFAVLQIVDVFLRYGQSGLRPSSIFFSVFTLVLGLLFLTSNDTTSDGRLTLLGSIFLVFGVLLGGLAFMIRARSENE